MSENLQAFEQAIWVCGALFSRGKVSGSAANMSFVVDRTLYITKSGSCFGRLDRDSFYQLPLDGEAPPVQEGEPSKELPLHRIFYSRHPEIKAVIHTHSPYATWWSCQDHEDVTDTVPDVTPYLRMRVGAVPMIPFAPPGSQELFSLLENCIGNASCALLKRHGAVAGSKSILDAFYDIEELEESARMLYLLGNKAERPYKNG